MVRWRREFEERPSLKSETENPRTANGRCRACLRSVERVGKESGKHYLFCKAHAQPCFIVRRDEGKDDRGWVCPQWQRNGELIRDAETYEGVVVFEEFRSGRGGWITLPGGRRLVVFRDCPGYDALVRHSLDRPMVVQWGGQVWNDNVVVENLRVGSGEAAYPIIEDDPEGATIEAENAARSEADWNEADRRALVKKVLRKV